MFLRRHICALNETPHTSSCQNVRACCVPFKPETLKPYALTPAPTPKPKSSPKPFSAYEDRCIYIYIYMFPHSGVVMIRIKCLGFYVRVPYFQKVAFSVSGSGLCVGFRFQYFQATRAPGVYSSSVSFATLCPSWRIVALNPKP